MHPTDSPDSEVMVPEAPWLRRHGWFLVVLAVGAVLRVCFVVGFRPAFQIGASFPYLSASSGPRPSPPPAFGYSWLELAPLSRLTDSLTLVVLVQHVIGLLVGIAVYVLLQRWGVWRWLSVVAAAPALLDSHLLTSEHLVLPDTLFVALCTGATLVLGWRSRPRLVTAASAGVLLGTASTVLAVGPPLLALGVLFWLLIGISWPHRVAGAVLLVLGFCVPIALYAGWQDSPTVDEVKATIGWGAGSGDVTDSVTGVVNGSDFDADRWDPDSFAWMAAVTDGADVGQDGLTRHDPAGDVVVGYSGWGTIPLGWLFAGTAVALIAALGLYRARRSGMRAVCALPAALPVAVFTGAVIGDEASWHSLPLAIVLVPAAGALAVTAILRGTRSPAADRPQVDLVDEAAVEDFAERYGEPAFAPIVVVIAAYNESTGLPRVLDTLATSVCGLDVDVVVVDDGSTDETAAVVRGHPRAYLASCRTNRGQGAALRLGYRLARTHGARFIITTDADGQYDAADFPAVLGPVVAGDADLVTGSRRLGHQHTYDRLRRLGVHVFGWLVSCLVGQYHTDTSFGLRAMRAELTEDVTLNQPQYQSAELLIGAHSHGWRVLEVPATMHVRAAGSTKKGRNLVYGTRYARVAVGTWWREGCPRPVSDEAPALQPLRVVRRRARVPRPAQTDRTAV